MNNLKSIHARINFWYVLVVAVFAVCLVRAFYLQVIRHEHYKTAALVGQHQEYVIPAERGAIRAYDGERIVPMVLGQTLYTVYADPTMVKDKEKTANKVAEVLGGDAGSYRQAFEAKGRYSVLARKIERTKKEALLKLELPGIGAQNQDYRTYPHGSLAGQLLGFVNDEGTPSYGIEQALDEQLAGEPGELNAVTDVNGVPLAASPDNVRKAPTPGDDVVLTLDVGMQAQVEQLLKAGLERAKSEQGSAMIIEAKTGAIKAMANYPSYNPGEFYDVQDGALFNNAAATRAIEIGSIMKPLTAAAALDKGVVQPDTTYFDPAKFEIDDATVRNVEEDGGPGQKSLKDIINLSLNTGATWLVQQMGGGELNKQARTVWHDYMVNHYRFSKNTGVEQGFENPGYVPSPTDGFGLNLTYANTAFGQAMTATITQVAGAYAAVLNGGTYYQPHLVAGTIAANGELKKNAPKVLAQHVVKPDVSQTVQELMEYSVENHRFARGFDNTNYSVGGKTGTAEIADLENGGYLKGDFNGTYAGFVGGDDPQYIIVVAVIKPKIGGYAGSTGAQPLFGDIAHMLLDNYNVSRRSKQ